MAVTDGTGRRIVVRTYEHGTYASYALGRCRCFPCQEANRLYTNEVSRERFERRPYRIYWARVTGSYVVRNRLTGHVAARGLDQQAAYKLAAELNDRNEAESGAPPPRWCGPQVMDEVREHLRKLRARGLGHKTIARIAGVNVKAIDDLVKGVRLRDGEVRPRMWIHRDTADKILGVALTATPAGGARVDGTETFRLLGELHAAGWTKTRIAIALGAKPRPDGSAGLQIGRSRKGRTVTGRIARMVKALHDREFASNPQLRGVCRCPDKRSTWTCPYCEKVVRWWPSTGDPFGRGGAIVAHMVRRHRERLDRMWVLRGDGNPLEYGTQASRFEATGEK